MKKNIVVCGAGFAGLSAVDFFRKNQRELEKEYRIILIDQKKASEFLPMLPDLLGEVIPANAIEVLLDEFADGDFIFFCQGVINKIDIRQKKVFLTRSAQEQLDFEYVILATGVKANFYGNESAREHCFLFNSIEAVRHLHDELRKRKKVNVVLVGAGYTGIEALTTMQQVCASHSIEAHFTIVEKADRILPACPEKISKYVHEELLKHGVTIICNQSLHSYDGQIARLSTQEDIDQCICVWTAGMHKGNVLKDIGEDLKGRLRIENTLRVKSTDSNCIFAAGDVCAFMKDQRKEAPPLRMAVMFALAQGSCTANNIYRSIKGMKLKEYRPCDLGYVVPLAYGVAPGIVLGMYVHPRIGFLLHYVMCLYRSRMENRLKLFKPVMKKIFKKKRQGV